MKSAVRDFKWKPVCMCSSLLRQIVVIRLVSNWDVSRWPIYLRNSPSFGYDTLVADLFQTTLFYRSLSLAKSSTSLQRRKPILQFHVRFWINEKAEFVTIFPSNCVRFLRDYIY